MAERPLKDTGAGTLSAADAGRDVLLAGWVARRRDHGGIVFFDLRDESGVVQIVVDPEAGAIAPDELHAIRMEYCIAVEGTVRWVSADASFTPYFALTEHDRSRLSYLAEIDLPGAAGLPSGVPLQADFPAE